MSLDNETVDGVAANGSGGEIFTLRDELHTLKETIVDGLIVIGEDKKVLSFNPGAEKIFGYPSAEVIGHNVKMLMPAPFHTQHDGHVESYCHSGAAKIIGSGREVAGRRKDGSIFPMYLSVGEMRGGPTRQFVGVIRDLSDFRAQQDLVSGIASNLPGPLFRRVHRVDGTITFTFVSEGLRKTFDLDPNAIMEDAANFLRAIHPDDRDGWVAAGKDAGEKMSPYDHEMRVIGDSGTTRWMRAIAHPERSETGDTVWDGLAIDITAQKQAEAQLLQAQKMDAVGQLTGGVAHDFNNLLAVLTMDLEELAAAHAGDKESEDLIREALGITESATDLTARLLAFSRQQDLKPEICDIRKVVAGSISLLHRTIGEHIELDEITSAQLWQVIIDPNQLENALLNIAVNARDAMPTGGRVSIKADNIFLDDTFTADIDGLQTGEYVQINVTDTGTGIPREIMDRVFDPFFTTKDIGAGSGLGLSMVYGFAKQSGGHATINSEIGHGTTISLYLPRALPAEAEAKRQDRAPNIETSSHETILMAEDFPQLRKRGAQMLNKLGYLVIEAENGEAALAALKAAEHVDLLFTDIVMPGEMNGVELAKRARAHQPGLKVLFTSGYAEGATFDPQTIDSGGARLQKPYSRDDLARTIRTALDSD